jgi:predicted dehydrogenase
VINTLMDPLHAPSAVKALNLGYHMLLEKPMATSLEDCIRIDQAARANGNIVSVCHSMRYHRTYQKVKELIDAGAIGQMISFDQLEAVEPIHQSHSFVRGNWGNQSRSSFMLMTKSCHDMDVLAWLVRRKCLKVSSFGSLTYFRADQAPPGAGQRCVDCSIESDCMYSAIKIYVTGNTGWAPYDMSKLNSEQRRAYLATSPLGRCVWHTDNDVVDHQVVNFLFDGEITGTFTMTAFATEGRYLRFHGTKGWLRASIDNNQIDLVQFPDNKQTIQLAPLGGTHGGADSNVMDNFIAALRAHDPNAVLTTTTQSLETHKIAFAAETARLESRVVDLAELSR